MGIIKLTPATTELGEVTIRATRPSTTMKSYALVINVEGSSLATTGMAKILRNYVSTSVLVNAFIRISRSFHIILATFAVGYLRQFRNGKYEKDSFIVIVCGDYFLHNGKRYGRQ